ncbi:MAG: hypothetical protein LUC93_14935, partial [Planctomycetaceae bacterium]|nr:hypothetical protein [Planctomycetaceae bacterium]
MNNPDARCSIGVYFFVDFNQLLSDTVFIGLLLSDAMFAHSEDDGNGDGDEYKDILDSGAYG